MSGPWNTPPAGSDLPPRNGSVARYETRAIYPRNTVTGADWKVGRELVFQFDSDPASGWLVPSETKLYCKFRVKTAAGSEWQILVISIVFHAANRLGRLRIGGPAT